MTARFGPRWAFYVRDVVARFQLQQYPTEYLYIADGRFPFREMDGSTDIHCSGVDGGRITLAQAIGEAIMLLVSNLKPPNTTWTILESRVCCADEVIQGVKPSIASSPPEWTYIIRTFCTDICQPAGFGY
jgi:hypothetical protein